MPSENLLNPSQIDFPYIDRVIEAALQIQDRPSRWRPVVALFRLAQHALLRSPASVQYISDNGDYADVAKPEIKVRLKDASAFYSAISARPAPAHDYGDIPSQDTFAAAFDLAQLARGAVRGFGNVYFVNCAPRKQQRGKEGKNGGESVYAGILPNGAIISGTGPDAFVHFKDLVEAGQLNLYRANVATNATQFRSRDYFPWLALILGNYVNRINGKWKRGLNVAQRDAILFGLNCVDHNAHLTGSDIPDLPNGNAVTVRADVHGNLKLGLRHDQIALALADNHDVVLFANGRTLEATLATHSFDKKDGVTAISAGSSGQWQGPESGVPWRDAKGQELSPLAEIFTVGGKAREQLEITDKNLRDGVEVHFIPAKMFKQVKAELSGIEGLSHTDNEIAKAIVSGLLVTGLNHANLQKALQGGQAATVVAQQLAANGATIDISTDARPSPSEEFKVPDAIPG